MESNESLETVINMHRDSFNIHENLTFSNKTNFTGLRIVLVFVIICLLVVHQHLRKYFDVWKKRNIPGPKPLPLFGNIKDVIFDRIHLADHIQAIYNHFPFEPAIGTFVSIFPFLIVKDLKLIQDVLVKSFSNFGDRGLSTNSDVNPLSQHLLYMSVDKWKPMRQRLAPFFSSARLQKMFYLMSECADKYVDYTQKLIKQNEIVDCYELSCKFSMNNISTCAFGLEAKTFSEEKTEFERVGEMVFESNLRGKLKRIVKVFPRWVAKLIEPLIKNQQLVNFFVNLMEKNITYRKENNVRRNDFLDLLIDIREHPEKIGEEEISMELLTAQAYVFFTAGFDTTSSTITFALYEMALNPSVQNLLRNEINNTMQRNYGKLNYDDLKSMKYLDQVVKETMRKYPIAYFTGRKAVADYTFPGTKITVPQGATVIIPIHSIHNDPNYYPNPDEFHPQRFTEKAEKMRLPMTYIPFGDGPRRCIGGKFAIIAIKLSIAKVIYRLKFETCDKTHYEKKMGKFLLSPNGKLFLKVTDLSHC